MASADEQAGNLAQQQDGVFSRHQLVAADVPGSTIDRRVSSDQWTRIAPGVFCLRGAPLGWRSQCRAAQLASPALVVARQTAARLHQFTHLDPRWRTSIELVTTGRSHPVGPWVIRATNQLPACHLTMVGELTTTTRERTMVDLAGCVRPGRFERMLDDELLMGRTTVDRINLVLSELAGPGRHGTAMLRGLLDDRSVGAAIPTSELERRLLEIIEHSDLPAPTTQFLPPWNHDVGVGCVDFAYAEQRLLIEVDGRRWHGNRFAFEADRRRDQLAVAAGWRTLRFTWSQLVDDADHVVEVIATTLTLAA